MFGLDISDRTLRLVELKKRRGKIAVHAANEIALPPKLIMEGEIANATALRPYVRELVQKSTPRKPSNRLVAACLPERKCFLKVIEIPRQEERELSSVIRTELPNHIPLDPKELSIDWQRVEQSMDEPGERMSILVGAAPKKLVHDYQAVLTQAGLTPVILEIESAAIARALLPMSDKIEKEGILIIDVGRERTSFIIWDQNIIQLTLGITSFSGEGMTKFLSGKLKLSATDAEKAKRLSGFDKRIGKGQVARILNEPLTKLVQEIRSIVDFYHDHYRHRNAVSMIILTGGGALMKKFGSTLASQLAMNVQIGDAFQNLHGNITHASLNAHQASFATAIGLALRSLYDDNA